MNNVRKIKVASSVSASIASALAAGLLSLSLLSGCAGDASEGINPRDAAQVAVGERVYRTYCSVCHGAELEGQPEWRRRLPSGRLPAPPHDDTGHTWHHANAELIAMVRDGMVPPLAPEGYESDMPAYADILTDDEIRAVLAFIQSRWSDEVWALRRQMRH